MTIEHIYLWGGLFLLGVVDLYLMKYPVFHPIVLLPAVGWLWGDLGTGLIVGGVLELVFGLAILRDIRKLNLVLYAGGLALYLNQQTHNVSLTLFLTMGLLLTLGLQFFMSKLKDWQKLLILFGISGIFIFLVPYGHDLPGRVPAQFIEQMTVAGSVLPWIFFAYAIWGLSGRVRNSQTVLGIPAILVGSIVCLKGYFWGPIAFIIIYYTLVFIMKKRDLPNLYLIDWALIFFGIYLMLPDFGATTFYVYGGLLLVNILFLVRNFAPIEIYLLFFIAGIILNRGGLLH